MNVERSVARTAFSMAADALRRRRCLLVTCRRSRQFAGRWHARNMRSAEKSHRSATNLCILTIVNAALHHNPNIHLQVRASQPAAECRARSAVDRGPGRPWRPEHDAGRVGGNSLMGVALAATGRRRRAGPGRGQRRGGERRRHPHRQARRRHPRGDRSQPAGQLSSRQPRRAAAARDRSARGRLDRADGAGVQGGRAGQGLPLRAAPPRRVAHRSRRRAAVRDRPRVRAAAERRARPPHRDRPGRGAGQWPASAGQRQDRRRGGTGREPRRPRMVVVRPPARKPAPPVARSASS